VWQHGSGFQGAIQSRQRAFGQTGQAWIDDLPNGSIAASFLSQLEGAKRNQFNSFLATPGLDLSPVLLRQGGAVFLAWSADYSPVQTLRQFNPKRNQRNTFWRVAVQMP